MARTRRDLTKPPVGEKFGKLTVLGFHGYAEKSYAIWLFQCDCGMKAPIRVVNVLSGAQKNCRYCSRTGNKDRDAALVACFASGKSFTAIAKDHGVAKGVVAGAIFRAKQRGELQGRTIVARSPA